MNIPNFQKSKQKISKKRGGDFQKARWGFLKSEDKISKKRGGYWAFFLRKFDAFIQNVYFCREIERGYRKRI